ncbi:MAG: aspartate kinase [Chitinispirillaceae bacterium]|nr:aspartate kinase [Chitinispirillaceae bacterium]
MNIIVCKFGGTSVATSEKLQQIVKILKQECNRRCVVLSAPGKTPGCPVKVTDSLITVVNKSLMRRGCSSELKELKQRFHGIYDPLDLSSSKIDEILAELDKRQKTRHDHPGKYRDLVVSAGEDINSKLFAEYLNSIDMPAVYVSPRDAGLVVTPVFGDAQPLPDSTLKLGASLKKLCSEKIVVFPGYFGYTVEGDVATFSRGGSDLTGSILAEAVDAAEYENWTDVDGIFSAHPSMVEKPMQIPALTYKEMRELSYIGFNVLHEEAVKPILRKKIPIRLRSTTNLANGGTVIISERLPSERDVIGIASGGGYCSFTLQKYLMNREKGFGRRLLSIFESLGLSYEHCPSGVDSISVILDQAQLKPEMVNTIIRKIEVELQPDDVRTEFGIALVAVVGEGLIHKIGVLAQAAQALAKAGVNIKMANQGSSEISMIFGIDADDERKAVNALYGEFFK